MTTPESATEAKPKDSDDTIMESSKRSKEDDYSDRSESPRRDHHRHHRHHHHRHHRHHHSSDRERDRDKGRDRDRDKERDKEPEKEKEKETEKELEREKERERLNSKKRPRSPSPDFSKKRDRDPLAYEKERMERMEKERERDERTVFITSLHPHCDERELFDYFSACGKVLDIRLIRDPLTDRSKGVCYIEFESRDSMLLALALNGQNLHGYPINVMLTQAEKNRTTAVPIVIEGDKREKEKDRPASKPMKLYIESIHHSISESDLKPIFEAFGPLDYLDIHRGSDDRRTGYGYIQFRNASNAQSAIDQLDGFELAGRPLKVSVAKRRRGDVIDSSAASRLDDEELGGGVKMTGVSRSVLMQRLQSGSSAISTATEAPQSVKIESNSPCIILKNMFASTDDKNLVLEIQEDVQDECSKFGKVLHCAADYGSQGCVYVQFEKAEHSAKAKDALSGRWFANRQISADFISVAAYSQRWFKN